MTKGYKLSSSGAALAVLFFFLPWVSLSCNGQQIASFTGWQLANGASLGRDMQTLVGDRWLFLVLFAGIGVLVLAYLAYKRQYLTPIDGIGLIAFGLVPLLTLFWRYVAAINNKEFAGVGIDPRLGVWGTIIGYACVIVGGYMNDQMIKNRNPVSLKTEDTNHIT